MIKVIVADDEKKICQLICNLIDFESLDMEVVAIAHNGIDALEKIKIFEPNIIITDIRMPGMDGLELIRKTREFAINSEFIIISGYRNFEYAQNAIKYDVSNYILKPIEQEELYSSLIKIKDKYQSKTIKMDNEKKLKQQNKQYIEQQHKFFFTNELFSHEQKQLSLEQINNSYSYNFKHGIFSCIILKIDIENEKEIVKENFKIIHEKIIQVFKNVFENFCQELEFFADSGIIYGIFNYAKQKEKEFQKEITSAFEALFVHKAIMNNLNFTLCLSEQTDDIDNLQQYILQCKTIMYNRIIEGTGKINKYRYLHTNKESVNNIFREFCYNIKISVEIFSIVDIKNSTNIFANNILKEVNDISGESIYFLIVDCFKYFISLFKHLNFKIDSQEIIINSFENKIMLCESLNDLLKVFEKTIISLGEEIIEFKKHENIKPIRIAKQYILENYMNAITLEIVSSIVNFNPSYFSSFFKKESGENFLEYLVKVRMDKAKELLRETDFTIANICEMVGYQDVKHFNHIFKKYTGIKPTEFRKLYS